jgi:hypothetical protein
MTITDYQARKRDTSTVNMVRGVSKKLPLSRATRGSGGKGKPRLASFNTGTASSRVLPTSSAGYWSPSLSILCTQFYKRLRGEVFLRGRFFLPIAQSLRYRLEAICRALQLLRRDAWKFDVIKISSSTPKQNYASKSPWWDSGARPSMRSMHCRTQLLSAGCIGPSSAPGVCGIAADLTPAILPLRISALTLRICLRPMFINKPPDAGLESVRVTLPATNYKLSLCRAFLPC